MPAGISKNRSLEALPPRVELPADAAVGPMREYKAAGRRESVGLGRYVRQLTALRYRTSPPREASLLSRSFVPPTSSHCIITGRAGQ